MGFSVTPGPKGTEAWKETTGNPFAAIICRESQIGLSPLDTIEVLFL